MGHTQAQPRMQISTVDVDGQPIRVGIRRGREGGVPLLMFNGIGANLELVEPFVDQLEGIETIAFDVPGIGGSPMPKLPYRFWTLAWLVSKMLDKLGYDVVDVVGVSWGGAVAQQFAFQYPKRCRKLILAATSAGAFMLPGKLSVIGKMANPRRYTDAAYMAEVGPKIYGGDFEEDPELLRSHIGRIRMETGTGYYLQLLAGVGWTSILWLHLLRQPTLVLAGSRDPIVPLVNARLLAWRIPDSTLHVFDDGHLFMVSRAAETAAIIQRFLEGEKAHVGPLAISIIKDEHRSLASVVRGLTYLVEEVQAGRMQPDFGLFRAMLSYIEDYPEKLHHPKEDAYLAKTLRARDRAAAAVLDGIEAEHARGSELVRELSRALGKYEASGRAGLEAFARALHAYAELLWAHMRREEEVVLPMAEKALTPGDWERIDAAFQSNVDPISGVDTRREFDDLFRRIVSLAPPPIGVGEGR